MSPTAELLRSLQRALDFRPWETMRSVAAGAGLPVLRGMAVGRMPREDARNPLRLLRFSHRLRLAFRPDSRSSTAS
jgi:hypothetical protein